MEQKHGWEEKKVCFMKLEKWGVHHSILKVTLIWLLRPKGYF